MAKVAHSNFGGASKGSSRAAKSAGSGGRSGSGSSCGNWPSMTGTRPAVDAAMLHLAGVADAPLAEAATPAILRVATGRLIARARTSDHEEAPALALQSAV